MNAFEKMVFDFAPDYTEMDGKDILKNCGDQSLNWAVAFCQFTKKTFDIEIPLLYVQGWFGNAIEYSYGFRQESERLASLPVTEEEIKNEKEIIEQTKINMYNYNEAREARIKRLSELGVTVIDTEQGD